MDNQYCVVITTVANRDEAATLARLLVEQQRAACVQRMPISSTYWWENAVQDEPEILLLIKTEQAHYDEVAACIRTHHSYSVPEILCLPVSAGSTSYLDWITATLHTKRD
jgi:periplasmic divalent cation tolerance protein